MEFHKVCSLLSDSAAYCMRQFLDHLFFLSNWAVGGSWCGLHEISGIFSEPEGLPFEAKHLWILSRKKKWVDEGELSAKEPCESNPDSVSTVLCCAFPTTVLGNVSQRPGCVLGRARKTQTEGRAGNSRGLFGRVTACCQESLWQKGTECWSRMY